MSELSFVPVHFDPPSPEAFNVAALLVSEVFHGYGNSLYPDAQTYIDTVDPEFENHYALTSSESGLLAAAGVIHEAEGVTHIAEFAVHPSQRRKGIGRILMEYLTEKALERGDHKLRLAALEPNFFASIGFTSIDDKGTMEKTIDPVSLGGRPILVASSALH